MEFALRRGYAHHWGNFVKNVWGQNEMVFWMMWMCLNVWFTLSNFGGRAARDMYKQALERSRQGEHYWNLSNNPAHKPIHVTAVIAYYQGMLLACKKTNANPWRLLRKIPEWSLSVYTHDADEEFQNWPRSSKSSFSMKTRTCNQTKKMNSAEKFQTVLMMQT